MPFGIETDRYPEDRPTSREVVSRRHGIQENEKIIMFSGLLNYKPNLDALKVILEKINPLLLARTGFQYKLFICGRGLPEEMNQLKAYISRNIIYTGFVKDIDIYNKAADVFINPVQSGGGIKTKMVEAIANGTSVVSTLSGAAGIDRSVCGEKLLVVNDNDWKGFAENILTAVNVEQKITPSAYYNKYHWKNIIEDTVSAFI
jgi:glycosyltransferase involved in cell wall biosynthesis